MTKEDLYFEFKQSGVKDYTLFLQDKILERESLIVTNIGKRFPFTTLLIGQSFDAGESSKSLRNTLGDCIFRLNNTTKGKFTQKKVNNRLIVKRIK
jgi:KaiC/GvpD/RAD55 family RecA-like ATPase